MKQRHLIRGGIFLAAALAFVVSLSTPVCAQTAQSFDAECRARPVKACSANGDPNPLLSLAGNCAVDLKRDANCCAHRSDGAEDYAIVKDCAASKPQGYLLIPVKAVTGVDDPQIFESAFVGLWAEAWQWSKEFPGQPAARTAVAINSAGKRSEQQLHIHISCVDREVRKTLWQKDRNIPMYSKYSPLNSKPLRIGLGVRRHTYDVVKVPVLAGENSPFEVVRALRRADQAQMAKQGIAVVAAKRTGGFYVLNTSEDDGGGHAEELLDQRCR